MHIDTRPAGQRLGLEKWRAALGDDLQWSRADFDDSGWPFVSIPHNWEGYEGYAAVSHGNVHGTAWYRISFETSAEPSDQLYAYFEGVGSYASVYCNGEYIGEHEGGRTTFTLNLSRALRKGKNILAVRAHHPEGIDDLPFVCGGCWGSPNTEGSQPFGIFRPAWLERTGEARILPFGIHVVIDHLSHEAAAFRVRTELFNAGKAGLQVTLHLLIFDPFGKLLIVRRVGAEIGGQGECLVEQHFESPEAPQLWSTGCPSLYKVKAVITGDGRCMHVARTQFGFRWVDWPTIRDPHADRNVRSSDSRRKMIASGVEECSLENNGHTTVVVARDEANIRLAPMGVLVRSQETSPHVCLIIELTIQNARTDEARVFCEIQNEGGTLFLYQKTEDVRFVDGMSSWTWSVPPLKNPRLWQEDDPYLYKLVVELRGEDGVLEERSETLFGIREGQPILNLGRPVFAPGEKMPIEETEGPREGRLRLNGEAVFLNGTCEYETLLGADHAFSDEQIKANTAMIHSAGFNAFRDAHHPHNLRYYHHWDRLGLLCWTQMASHVWFDNPRFRENYKRLTAEWVRERRNHPSIIVWGLQNESSLPEDFTRELCEIVRAADQNCSGSRLIVTCNGGQGSDWNVPQEWSGTYGGNCNDYDLEELQMVGEYGAWRAFGVHTNAIYQGHENDASESWACYALETKIRLGESVRDRAIGHFQWAFNTFPNPGRSAEVVEGPGNAGIGSVNNKGLVTAWHQPSDLYYLYRSNYADPARSPMVYIVSHSWPHRWREMTRQNLSIYSNCEEVELFNGVGICSLGRKKNPGRGRHFVWEEILPASPVLHAVGYQNGRAVAEDVIQCDSERLPYDESLAQWTGGIRLVSSCPENSLYRISCGSSVACADGWGRVWSEDRCWNDSVDSGWESWGNKFSTVPAGVASFGMTMTPARGTAHPALYWHYRYGREQLRYHFRTGPGTFRVTIHFIEPWFGIGEEMDCSGWRVFDLAVNENIVEKDLDIFAQSGGHHRALERSFLVTIEREIFTLHFPRVRVNQAVVSAIEICLA